MPERICDVCQERSKHPVLSQAQDACQLHMLKTGHEAQMIDYGQGWTCWWPREFMLRVR